MLCIWKIPHIIKGLLTHAPGMNALRLRRMATGGSDSARYCYSVWLRHLNLLSSCGFKISQAHVGELGPGDSIGIGLAALLSGARSYIGLDLIPFSRRAILALIFEELSQMYQRQEPIPGEDEFPKVRPRLSSYAFPVQLIDRAGFDLKAAKIRAELKEQVGEGDFVKYRAPWISPHEIAPASLDLVFSQAVLEHVDDLQEAYHAMRLWLKPGGYASHVIDFSAHYLSPFWNGHWGYTDWEWQLVLGRREFLLNRQPLSAHLAYAVRAGLRVLRVEKDYNGNGLDLHALAKRFRGLDREDLRTRGAILILRNT